MHIRFLLIFLVIISFSVPAFSQKVDTLSKKLDSMQKKEEKHEPIVDVNKDEYTSKTNITLNGYFVLLGTDLLQEVRSPFHATKKTYLIAGGFVAVEGIIFFAADKPAIPPPMTITSATTGMCCFDIGSKILVSLGMGITSLSY